MIAWLVCDGRCSGEHCLYTERSASRLKSTPERCVRHGAILGWRHTKATDRKEARRELGLERAACSKQTSPMETRDD